MAFTDIQVTDSRSGDKATFDIWIRNIRVSFRRLGLVARLESSGSRRGRPARASLEHGRAGKETFPAGADILWFGKFLIITTNFIG